WRRTFGIAAADGFGGRIEPSRLVMLGGSSEILRSGSYRGSRPPDETSSSPHRRGSGATFRFAQPNPLIEQLAHRSSPTAARARAPVSRSRGRTAPAALSSNRR